MKRRLIIWLSLELLVASGMSASVCILRHSETRAYLAWRDHPTAETRATLDRERAITFCHHVVLGAVLFGGMGVITIPLVRAFSHRRSPEL